MGGGILLTLVVALFLSSFKSAATSYNINVESKANKVFVSDPASTFTYCNHSAQPYEVLVADGGNVSRVDYPTGPIVGSIDFQPGAVMELRDMNYIYPYIPEGKDPHGTHVDIRWDNVGKIGDRWVRVWMAVLDMEYTKGNPDKAHPTLIVYKDFWYGMWMSNVKNARVVYRFFYMDTGERVDMTNNYVTWCSLNVGEGVTLNYDGVVDGYISDDSLVEWRGQYYGSKSNAFDDYIGGPTLYKSGITFKVPEYLIDAKLWGVGNSWVKPDFASIFATIPTPEKSVDKSKAILGEEVTYTIDQGLSGVTLYKYNSLAFEDDLPDEVDYVSSTVKYRVGGNTRVLTKGVDYTETYVNGLLRVTFSNTFVRNLQYSDEFLQFVIKTKVNENAMSKDKIVNKGITTVNTSRFETNTVETEVVKYKIVTSKEGEGTIDPTIENIPKGENKEIKYKPADGWYLDKILVDDVDKGTTYPNKYAFNNISADHKIHAIFKPYHKVTTEVINGTISDGSTTIKDGGECNITYSPNTGYYLKTIEVDGTSVNIKDYWDNYKFTNITSNHHIKVIYAKIPTLTIVKKIDKNDLVWDKGYPYFSFKISGTDYLGNSVTLYKVIKFSESDANTKEISFKITAGTYSIKELPTNEWELDKVENISNCSISNLTASCDLRDKDGAKCRFTNEFVDYSDYSENDDKVNKLK